MGVAMPAVTYDMTIEQGAVYSVVFEWREDDGSDPPTGDLIPTGGYQAFLQIRTRPHEDLLASFAEGDGLTNDGNGSITLRIGADETSAITRGGQYDLELHNIADPTEVIRLAEGKVTLDYEITLDTP